MRDSFKNLMTELKRIEETAHTASSTGSPVEGSLMAELCRHLCQFVQARQDLNNLYLFLCLVMLGTVESFSVLKY